MPSFASSPHFAFLRSRRLVAFPARNILPLPCRLPSLYGFPDVFHLVYHLRLPTRTFLRPILCDSFTFLHFPASRRTTRQHSGPDVHTTRSALCSAPPPLSSCPPPGRPAEPDTFVRHFASLCFPPFATLRCFPGPQYTTTALPSLPPFCGFPPSPPLPPAAAQ